jgi:hypothetical protein
MTVFREVYEIVGASEKKRAQVFITKQTASLNAQWDVCRALGAKAFRPSHDGTMRSLLFAPPLKVRLGLRRIGTDRGHIEYQPSLNTKAGRAIAKQLAEAPRVESLREFANTFDWHGRSPMSTEHGRGIIYFCAGVHVRKPKERFFVTFPRELKDGWKAPKGLKLVRESDMLRAIEDHNALVAKRKKAA